MTLLNGLTIPEDIIYTNSGSADIIDGAISGTGTLDNSGLLQTEGDVSIASTLDSAGTIAVESGTLSLDEAYAPGNTISGTLTGAGTLDLAGLDGQTTLDAGASVDIAAIVVGSTSALVLAGDRTYGGVLSSTDEGYLDLGGHTLTLNASPADSFYFYVEDGTLVLDGTAALNDLSIGNATVQNTGTGTLNNGAITGYGTLVNTGLLQTSGTASIAPTLDNAGTIDVVSGTLELTGSVDNTGTIVVGDGAAVDLAGSATQTVAFATGAGQLELDDPAGFTGAITGLTSASTLELSGVSATSAYLSTDLTTLDVAQSNGTTLSFDVAGDFAGGAVITGGQYLTVVVACYARGTRIATPSGDVAIEELRIGDRVVTAAGAARPIRWIGRRAYRGRFAARNPDILPVVIRAGALGDDVPRRDLTVSPLHAMFLDGLLIPAIRLVNGVSIIQRDHIEQVEYFHIELDTHDVLVAEGAPSESFVDDDSRMMFHNAAEYAALYPDARQVPAFYCAPRVTEGFALAAIEERLAARAGIRPAPAPVPLRGYLDLVGHTLIEGWAQNPDRPEVPVCLDVVVDGVARVQTLANRFRADLAAAGVGSGHHGFSVRLREALTAAARASVVVRRSSDRSVLARSDACAEAA